MSGQTIASATAQTNMTEQPNGLLLNESHQSHAARHSRRKAASVSVPAIAR